MHRIARSVLVTALFIAFNASAQTPTLHQFSGLALSPKGDLIATIEQAEPASSAAAAPTQIATAAPAASAPASSAAPSAPHGVIVLRAANDGHVVRTIDPCAKCGYSGLAFGPDSRLAYLSRDREAGTIALMLDSGAGSANAAAQRGVATVKGIAQTPRFSPDGKRIALLVTIGAAKEAGAREAGVRLVGDIGQISDMASDKRRIAVFDAGASVAADDVKPVSPADRYVYEYSWTPDGNGFVATTAPGNGDNNWWIATLDAIDATTGGLRQIAKPATQLNFPRVSPDGQTVAYIGGVMSDFGSVGGDVWTVPFAGGAPANITAGTDVSHVSLDWLAGGLRSVALGRDTLRAVSVDATGKTTTLWSHSASMAAGDGRIAWSADGHAIATVAQDYEHPPEIFAGPVAAPVPITHDNAEMQAIVTARSIEWRSGPYSVQGWLIAPRGADPARKAPMITVAHGGPAAASMPGFLFQGTPADLIKAGYYLFYPNPRGSYGQGEAFTAANKRDFGGGDLKDILAGIDAVEKVAPIDDARLGLMGGSYGGFMGMWANTQTNRFKAIAAGAGLSNWVSYYGTNGIDQWMLPFFGKTMYDDRKAYEDVSAINFIKNAKTPTFIYVGERDIEVPPTQSIEYWHALKEMGVPTTLVIYPNEGHGIRSREAAADVRKRLVGWSAKYLRD